MIVYGLLNWTLFAEARRRSRWQGVDRVIGRTVEALTVILVPMLVLDNYFINSGLAELWWILAGLLFAGVPTILNEEGRAKLRPFGLAVGTTANAMSSNRNWD